MLIKIIMPIVIRTLNQLPLITPVMLMKIIRLNMEQIISLIIHMVNLLLFHLIINHRLHITKNPRINSPAIRPRIPNMVLMPIIRIYIITMVLTTKVIINTRTRVIRASHMLQATLSIRILLIITIPIKIITRLISHIINNRITISRIMYMVSLPHVHPVIKLRIAIAKLPLISSHII